MNRMRRRKRSNFLTGESIRSKTTEKVFLNFDSVTIGKRNVIEIYGGAVRCFFSI